MRKLVIILQFLVSPFIAATANDYKEISVHFDEKDFLLESFDGESYISCSSMTTILKEDTLSPALPYKSIYILVRPEDQYAGSVILGSEVLWKENVKMAHNPAIVTNNMFPRRISSDASISHLSYPNSQIEYTGAHFMGPYKFLSFLVCPFRYESKKQKLYMSTDIKIKIELSHTNIATNISTIYGSLQEEESVRNLVVNYDEMSSLYPSFQNQTRNTTDTLTFASTPLQYLIITRDSLRSEFQRLADWKNIRGVKTQVITIEDIYNTYLQGRNNQLKVKIAIWDYYNFISKHNLKYVLLGGLGNIVPIQNCYGELSTQNEGLLQVNAPADIFYACLTNLDWDVDGDNKYGEIEDNIDVCPQLAVSRLPIQTKTEARSIIDRIISYEKNPYIDVWDNKILMCAVENTYSCNYNGQQVSINHATSERMYEEYIGNTGWNGDKFRFYDTGTDYPNGASYNITDTNFQLELSKGYPFINVNNHGVYNMWEMEGGYAYDINDAVSLSNPKYTIITTEACHTNDITYPNSLGCTLMKNPNSGIIFYYGSSRQNVGLSTGYMGPGEIYAGLFYFKLFGNTNNIGLSIKETKGLLTGNCNSYNGYRWLQFFLNSLGCPEMPVYTDTPEKFNNVRINHYNSSFNIEPNIERGHYCLMSRLDKGNSYYNSDDDHGNNMSFTNLSGEYLLCLTKKNCIPYRVLLGPSIYLQNESLNDNLNVTADYTYIGRDLVPDRPVGAVTLENGHSVIESRYGVNIVNDFEVKIGASLDISTNQPIE